MDGNGSEDRWLARFAWFWYNAPEIWHASQEDIDAKMRVFAEQGITHIETFSNTHFRWSYKPWWKEINECLAKVVKAAHKYGIKVIEHHSSCLTYYPDDDCHGKHKTWLAGLLRACKSSFEDWPGIVEYNLDETKEEATWEQVDAVDGSKISTWYHGHIKCPNNPHYVAAYLKYLESVYATGVDGIMTDDMQFANQNIYLEDGSRTGRLRSCGCRFCREKFKAKYGYELPSPDKWDAWFGSRDDRTFLDYIRFRHESTLDFHRAVKRHYEGLALKMLRPNYNSTSFQSNERGTWPGIFPQLDWFAQECQNAHVISTAWPHNLFQQKLIAMYARRRGIPDMMAFYAVSDDALMFTFGQARLAGAMYGNTSENGQCIIDETAIRSFEKRHAQLIFHSNAMAQVAFLDSEENRFYSAGYCETRLPFWVQAALFARIPTVIIGIEEPERWNVPVLVANEVHLLTAKQVARLKAYAENGGTLVLTGICGEQDAPAFFRSRDEVNALWGLDLYDESIASTYRVIRHGRGNICVVGYDFGFPGDKDEHYRRFVFDEQRRHRDNVMPRRDCIPVGAPRNPASGKNERPLPEWYCPYSENKARYDEVASLLARLLGEKASFKAELPDMIMAVPFHAPSENAVAVQLLNAAGTLPERNELVSHKRAIPFPKWTGPDGSISISLPDGVAGASAEFCTVTGQAVPLKVQRLADRKVKIQLSAGLLKDYAMIVLR